MHTMVYRIHQLPGPVGDVIVHVGYDIRTLRNTAWLTQTRLSELAGVSQSTMSLLENGLAEALPVAKLAQVAAVFHADLLIRPCPHPRGTSTLPTIGRVARESDGTLHDRRGR
jgi:DNA-binding XRE family transcriptional regulator